MDCRSASRWGQARSDLSVLPNLDVPEAGQSRLILSGMRSATNRGSQALSDLYWKKEAR